MQRSPKRQPTDTHFGWSGPGRIGVLAQELVDEFQKQTRHGRAISYIGIEIKPASVTDLQSGSGTAEERALWRKHLDMVNEGAQHAFARSPGR